MSADAALHGDALRELWIEQVIAQHPKEWEIYRNGRTSLANFFVGQVMRASAYRANPHKIRASIETRGRS